MPLSVSTASISAEADESAPDQQVLPVSREAVNAASTLYALEVQVVVMTPPSSPMPPIRATTVTVRFLATPAGRRNEGFEVNCLSGSVLTLQNPRVCACTWAVISAFALEISASIWASSSGVSCSRRLPPLRAKGSMTVIVSSMSMDVAPKESRTCARKVTSPAAKAVMYVFELTHAKSTSVALPVSGVLVYPNW
eukprot:2290738-Rhodomonas_salina.1